ncbi:MAG: FoF1 ATP synthase subunit a [Patescibacteria group bacterium]
MSTHPETEIVQVQIKDHEADPIVSGENEAHSEGNIPEISIKAEPVFHTNYFTLTNSLLLSAIVLVFFTLLALRYKKDVESKHKTGFFYVFNSVLKVLHGLFGSIMGANINFFFPILAAFFIYILLQNWFGLLPGVGSIMIAVNEGGHILHVPLFRANNADLNATLAIALISVGLIQVYGIKFLGFKGYIQKFINLSNPINFLLGILEIVSEISKVVSFAFRLFGNIFAGEVLMTIVAFLVPVLASFPFLILEIFVGMVQALVFSLLTSVFMNLAIAKHH